MSEEWLKLSMKEKEAVKYCIENRTKMSLSAITGNVYTKKGDAKKGLSKLRKTGMIEESRIGNKYNIRTSKVPDDIIEGLKNDR